MTELPVRRLLVDLDTPIERHWFAGDPFRSAFFNALSFSFPVGEQFFIDSLRAGLDSLPAEQRVLLAAEVQGFIGQEATHRHIHARFNTHLEALGYKNGWAPRAQRRVNKGATRDVRIRVGATAAVEHFTAILADWILGHPEVFSGAEARLATMWQWHAAEESEHRSTAFEMYVALGGRHDWRIRIMGVVTFNFLTDLILQTVRNLRHDRCLFRWQTMRSAWSLLFARGGIVREAFVPWLSYFSKDFHPRRADPSLAGPWLAENAGQYATVGARTGS